MLIGITCLSIFCWAGMGGIELGGDFKIFTNIVSKYPLQKNGIWLKPPLWDQHFVVNSPQYFSLLCQKSPPHGCVLWTNSSLMAKGSWSKSALSVSQLANYWQTCTCITSHIVDLVYLAETARIDRPIFNCNLILAEMGFSVNYIHSKLLQFCG